MSTIWLEFTRRCWFPPVVDQTPFGNVYRLGWFGLGFSRHNLTAWVKEWHTGLKAALPKGSKSPTKGQHS